MNEDPFNAQPLQDIAVDPTQQTPAQALIQPDLSRPVTVLQVEGAITAPVPPILSTTNPMPGPIADQSKPSGNSKNLIKALVVIVVVVLLIISGYFLTKYFMTSGKAPADASKLKVLDYADLFDPRKPIIIKERKDQYRHEYGVISADGDVIVKPKYYDIKDYVGDYAVATEETEEGLVQRLIDKKGKVKATGSISNVASYGNWIIGGKLFDKNLKQLTADYIKVGDFEYCGYIGFSNQSNNTAGIINGDGKIIYTTKSYDFGDGSKPIFSFDRNNFSNKCIDTKKDIYGVITTTQNSYDNNGDAGIVKSKHSIMNLSNNKVIYERKYETLPGEYDDGYGVKAVPNSSFLIKDSGLFMSKDYRSDSGEAIYIKDDKIVFKVDGVKSIFYKTFDSQALEIKYSGKAEKTKWYDIKSNKIVDAEPKNNDNRTPYDLSTGLKIFNCSDGYSDTYGLMENGESRLPCDYDKLDLLDSSLYGYFYDKLDRKLIMAQSDETSSDKAKTLFIDIDTKEVYKTFDGSSVERFASYKLGSVLLFTNWYEKQADASLARTKKHRVHNILTGNSLDFDYESYASVNIHANYFAARIKDNNESVYFNYDLKEVYRGKCAEDDYNDKCI